jgi:lipoate-protein ligase B
MAKQCYVHRLGLVLYERAWRLQEELAGEIAGGARPPTLLLLEHPHTYTFGRRGVIENLLWDEAELTRRGVSVHWVDRGGDVTYHGPGQLVGYPLLSLAPGGLYRQAENKAPGVGASGMDEPGEAGVEGGARSAESGKRIPQADFIGYLRHLELTLIQATLQLGVTGRQVEGFTGVWVENEMPNTKDGIRRKLEKIASIGVKVDAKGISRHGFALNVNPDMTYWEGIVGCGLKGKRETSLAELTEPTPDMDRVIDEVIAAFGETFGYSMVEKELSV